MNFFFSAKVEGVHREFQKAVRAGVCRFIPETGTLLLITLDESSQKKARMIQEMHFRNLSQKVTKLMFFFCNNNSNCFMFGIGFLNFVWFVFGTGFARETH